MSKRNPRARWTLPETINPEARRCYIIRVPDERYHVAAFLGALLDLASGMQWADDAEHKAREVALVWRDVIDEMLTNEDCAVFQPCSDSNVPFVDEVDGCQRFTIHIKAGDFMPLPTFVRPGDTLEVINVHGVWRDGITFVSDTMNWWNYEAGEYNNPLTAAPTSAGDIVPTVPHMGLLARFDDDGTPYYWQISPNFGGTLTLTIPSSVDVNGVKFELFANGPLLSESAYDLDNIQPQGEICIVLEICHTITDACAALVTFDEGSWPYDIVIGTIVNDGPLGSGDSLFSDASVSDRTSELDILLDECTLGAASFDVWREVDSIFDLTLSWQAYDALDVLIDDGLMSFSVPEEAATNVNFSFPTTEGVARLHLTFNISLGGGAGGVGFWIDNIDIE